MQNILIICNGLPPSRQLLRKSVEWAEFIIGADGGGNVARSLDISPDMVVGDLDSFERRETDTFEVMFKPDQETNDLEKALDQAVEREADNVVVLGATGQRLDQTLKNLSVLKKYDHHFKDLIFRDNYGEVILLSGTYTRDLPLETTLSLFPLSGKVSGIVTNGLKYPLKGESLENGARDGSSNKVISNPVTIRHEKGDLLLFIAHK